MTIGDTFELSIHEKHLDTGVHEYMVWFDATCVVISAGVQLHVACEMPDYAHEPHGARSSDSMLDQALLNIRRGVEHALLHRRYGLHLRIHEFKVHAIDFQPSMFLLHTYYYTRRQLELLDHAEN